MFVGSLSRQRKILPGTCGSTFEVVWCVEDKCGGTHACGECVCVLCDSDDGGVLTVWSALVFLAVWVCGCDLC